MKVEVTSRKVNGSIKVPSSKSDAHRALICASLAKNQISVISNLDINDDINATINALRNLGAKITLNDNKAIVEGSNLDLNKHLEFDANESGSTLRFLIPLFANFSKTATIKGSKKLLERPLNIYKEIMNEGLTVSNNIMLNYKFKPGNYQLKGNISSQFISGLLFLLPLLDKDSQIEIIEPFESKSYVLLTLNTLNKFGVNVSLENNLIKIPGNQKYQSINYEVEGDYSQAAFFLALGAINNDLEVEGLNPSSLQGDKKIIDILISMGAKIEVKENSVKVIKSKLNGTQIDLADCPDLGPILMALAPFCEGETHITNIARLRLKESDRVGAMKEELNKFNVIVKEEENDIYISKTNIKSPSVEINSHNDHRIAMSLSVLTSSLDNGKMILNNANCINKSYPNFYKDLNSINGMVVELND